MSIFRKLKITAIIINFFALVLIFYFSFYIYPNVNSLRKYDYKEIKSNADKIYSPIYILNGMTSDKQKYINEKKKDLLSSFIKYFGNSPSLIANAPCPNQLTANNLRNIRIYEPDQHFSTDAYSFNVRFLLNKSLSFGDAPDIDKCFNYIFVENLNKFYLKNRENLIKSLEDDLNIRSKIKEFILKESTNISPSATIPFSTFIEEVNKGNVVSVDISGNFFFGIFSNEIKFKTVNPGYIDIISFLNNKRISVSVDKTINEKFNLENFEKRKIEEFLIYTATTNIIIQNLKDNVFFVDPKLTYMHSKILENNSIIVKLITFFICLLITITINIAVHSFNKKKMTEFIKNLINY